MEAYIHGVSTRKVDDLVTALGIEAGVSKAIVITTGVTKRGDREVLGLAIGDMPGRRGCDHRRVPGPIRPVVVD